MNPQPTKFDDGLYAVLKIWPGQKTETFILDAMGKVKAECMCQVSSQGHNRTMNLIIWSKIQAHSHFDSYITVLFSLT